LDTVNIKNKDGVSYFEIEGPLFDEGDSKQGKFWIATSEIGRCCNRGQTTLVAQFYRLVVPGLILTRHIFEGLDRPLFCDSNMDGDKSKYVFSRKPAWDYVWKDGAAGQPHQRTAPDKSVFVVIISKNDKHKHSFPEVDGWIERWNWVKESGRLMEAPARWVDRYEKKLWTRR